MAKEKGLSLTFQIEGKIKEKIYSDLDRLKQVLLNLLINSIKFTQVGGIEITGETPEDKLNLLRISVKDSGVGISNQQRKNLFNPNALFNLQKRQEKGVGFGLIFCKNIVSYLGPYDKVASF